MNKPFDPTKPVQTRDGRKVRIICTDLEGTYPIAAQINQGNGCFQIGIYSHNGIYRELASSELDLINIPTKREGWVNLYSTIGKNFARTSDVHESKEIADAAAFPTRIACVRIEWEE